MSPEQERNTDSGLAAKGILALVQNPQSEIHNHMIYRFLIALLWSQRRVVLWLIAIGIVTVAVFYIKRNDLHIYMDSYHTRNKLREEVDQLQAEAKALQKEREDLTKGGFQIEKVARERFRLSRPGEIVVYLDSPKTAGSSETLKKTMNDGR